MKNKNKTNKIKNSKVKQDAASPAEIIASTLEAEGWRVIAFSKLPLQKEQLPEEAD